MVQQRQQGECSNGRRGEAIQQTQQHVRMMQQQRVPRGRVYHYPPWNRLLDDSMPGKGILSVPYDIRGMQLLDASIRQGILVKNLAIALKYITSPKNRMDMLGENLYPLVKLLEPNATAKVTGMLLELDNTEVLHLIESQDALKAKVAEAMEVLKNAGWKCD